MNSKYEQQMKKGVLDLLVLKLLVKEKKYGYQLISELKELSGGMIVLKEGTLYPILYRLEDEELVVSEWSVPKGKEVSRKYYMITEKGKEFQLQLQELWKTFSNQVNKILEE